MKTTFRLKTLWQYSLCLLFLCLVPLMAQAQTVNITVPKTVEGAAEEAKPYTTSIAVISPTEDVTGFKATVSDDLKFTAQGGSADPTKNLPKNKITLVAPPQIPQGEKGGSISVTTEGMVRGEYSGEITLSADKPLNPAKIPLHIKVTPGGAGSAGGTNGNGGVGNPGNGAGNTGGATVLPASIALALTKSDFPFSQATNGNSGSPSSGFTLKSEAGNARALAFRAADKSVKSGRLFYVENPDGADATLPLPTQSLTAGILYGDKPIVNGGKPDGSAPGSPKGAQGQPLNIPLDVNSLTSVQVVVETADLAPGRYSGSLNLLVPDRSPLQIPVTVTVRKGPFFALLSLAFGVIVGLALSVYRSRFLPRDQILARIGRLQLRIQQIAAFHTSGAGTQAVGAVFAERLQAKLADARTADANDADDVAKTRLDEADAVFTRWTLHSTDWINLLRFTQDLAAQAAKASHLSEGTSLYLNGVANKLTQAESSAPDDPDTSNLRSASTTAGTWFTRYQNVQTRLREIDQLLNLVPTPMPPNPDPLSAADRKNVNDIRTTHRDNYRSLDLKTPDEANAPTPGGSTVMEDAIRNEDTDLNTLKGILRSSGHLPPANLTSGVSREIAPPAPVPVNPVAEGKAAQQRINWYYWISYGLLAILLIWAGFSQAYWPKATFGAVPLDYLTLIAWGFGVDTVSRSTLLGVFNTLPGGVPAPPTH